jgi:hypothetical protein
MYQKQVAIVCLETRVPAGSPTHLFNLLLLFSNIPSSVQHECSPSTVLAC